MDTWLDTWLVYCFSRFFDRNTGTNNALAAGNDVAAQSLQKEKQ